MRLLLIHVGPRPARTTPSEHVGVLVPGAADRTVFEVPVTALERFLPLLVDATQGLSQPCPACGEDLASWPCERERGR